MSYDRLSAVIPCYNAAATVDATLRSLANSRYPVDEVLCVDDGSTDRTADAVRQTCRELGLPGRLLSMPANRGAAAARNLGAAQATGDFLLFIDSDVVVRPQTVGALVQRQRCAGVSAVIGLYEPRSASGGRLAHFQSALAHLTFRRLADDDLPYFGTQCALIRRELFIGLGGFQETYTGASVEDLEFGVRLRDRGHRIALATTAPITHNRPYTFRSFTANYLSKAIGLAALLRWYGGRRTALGTGYSSWGNLASLGLLAAAMLGGALALAPAARGIAALVMATSLGGLAASWAPLLGDALRQGGPRCAAAFLLLRAYVTMIGAVGALLVFAGVTRSRSPASRRCRDWKYF